MGLVERTRANYVLSLVRPLRQSHAVRACRKVRLYPAAKSAIRFLVMHKNFSRKICVKEPIRFCKNLNKKNISKKKQPISVKHSFSQTSQLSAMMY